MTNPWKIEDDYKKLGIADYHGYRTADGVVHEKLEDAVTRQKCIILIEEYKDDDERPEDYFWSVINWMKASPALVEQMLEFARAEKIREGLES